jgi:hypothetical protein
VKEHAAAVKNNDIAAEEGWHWLEVYLGGIVGQVVAADRYNQIQRIFSTASTVLLAFGAIAAIAITVFVWAINPPATTSSSKFAFPAQGIVTLDSQGRQIEGDVLGKSCVSRPFPAIILSQRSNSYDAVTVPSKRCKLAEVTITSDIGSVRRLLAVGTGPTK